jgi:hypothetical protein
VGLPFLKNNWPRLLKLSGETHYGYSQDDELKDKCLEELMQAFEQRDSKRLMEGVIALIDLILQQEGDKDAAQSHEIA